MQQKPIHFACSYCGTWLTADETDDFVICAGCEQTVDPPLHVIIIQDEDGTDLNLFTTEADVRQHAIDYLERVLGQPMLCTDWHCLLDAFNTIEVVNGYSVDVYVGTEMVQQR